jgi:hypothetical protein
MIITAKIKKDPNEMKYSQLEASILLVVLILSSLEIFLFVMGKTSKWGKINSPKHPLT